MRGHGRRNWIVDRHKRDRFPGFLASAEVEGRDIDVVLTEFGAERTDEAGLVVVDDVDHLSREFGFDKDSEHLDQPRRAIAEQGAFDAPFSMVRADRHRYERVIVTFALVADLADGDAAFLREIRRVDHVHRVGPATHHSCQHRSRDGLDVELGRGSLNLDVDRADLGAGDLTDQPPELLRETHIGLRDAALPPPKAKAR